MVVTLADLIDHREHIVRVLATQVSLDDHEEKVRVEIFEMLFVLPLRLLGVGEARCKDWRKAQRVHPFSRQEPRAYRKAPLRHGCCSSLRN